MSEINFIDYKQAGRRVMFAIFDGRTAAPVLAWMLFPSWIMAQICLGLMAIMALLNINGINLEMGVRKIRRILAGRRVSCRSHCRESKIK